MHSTLHRVFWAHLTLVCAQTPFVAYDMLVSHRKLTTFLLTPPSPPPPPPLLYVVLYPGPSAGYARRCPRPRNPCSCYSDTVVSCDLSQIQQFQIDVRASLFQRHCVSLQCKNVPFGSICTQIGPRKKSYSTLCIMFALSAAPLRCTHPLPLPPPPFPACLLYP